ILIKMGSLSSASGRYERTALHWLALNTQKNSDQILSGANFLIDEFLVAVNAQDDQGNTALHYASQNARPSLVKRLLEARADPSIANDEGKTPLHVAAQHFDDPCMKILIEHKFYKEDSNLDVVDRHDRTPLMLYAAHSCTSIEGAKILLDAGANVNFSGDQKMYNYKGQTALHHVARMNKDNKEMIGFLLSRNANKDAQDMREATALWHAVNNNNRMAVDELIRAKAS
ncbi:hypothetical protein PMAYCL1PPCAC_01934, partial [Pristionchus mayeri]